MAVDFVTFVAALPHVAVGALAVVQDQLYLSEEEEIHLPTTINFHEMLLRLNKGYCDKISDIYCTYQAAYGGGQASVRKVMFGRMALWDGGRGFGVDREDVQKDVVEANGK